MHKKIIQNSYFPVEFLIFGNPGILGVWILVGECKHTPGLHQKWKLIELEEHLWDGKVNSGKCMFYSRMKEAHLMTHKCKDHLLSEVKCKASF